jgi:murein DD-endopeptidase MepM/ murein hydrolase activator NlpD
VSEAPTEPDVEPVSVEPDADGARTSDPTPRVEITPTQLWVLRAGFFGGLLAIVALGVSLSVVLPRSMAYEGLILENLELRSTVRSLDQRMSEVDRILLRLRIYEAQLQGLTEVTDDAGPLDDVAEPAPADDLVHDERGLQLRPAQEWADSVMARADNFLAVFEKAEPDLNELVAELEDLRALEEALPAAWPATGSISSGFGYRRHPLGRWAQFHKGVDISDRQGSSIRAAAPGRVTRAFYNSGYGRFVEIDHGYGITTRYAHMNRILVKKGDRVARGHQVGTMGRTGRVTGTHLHFEVRIDGHAVDPMDYLPRH